MNLVESHQGAAAEIAAICSNCREQTVTNDQKAGTGWRKTSILDGKFVLKEFDIPTHEIQEQPWQIEHQMLSLLQQKGIACPKSLGYTVETNNGRSKITYCRACVEGTELQAFTPEDMPFLGRFFAALHSLGIVTNDAFIYNFIRSQSGDPMFIDYGKASWLPEQGLKFQWRRARGLTKFFRGALFYDRALFQAFMQQYRQHYKTSPVHQFMGTVFFYLFLGRRYLRNLQRGRSLKS